MLVDYKKRKLKVGSRVCVQFDIPSPDGMLYKNTIVNQSEFKLFWECSEELSEQFPWKAELHQFMILTALRKQEALKVKKSYINWKKRIIDIPRGIEKNRTLIVMLCRYSLHTVFWKGKL